MKTGRDAALLEAINNETLDRGSIAGDEYIHDMRQARLSENGEI